MHVQVYSLLCKTEDGRKIFFGEGSVGVQGEIIPKST